MFRTSLWTLIFPSIAVGATRVAILWLSDVYPNAMTKLVHHRSLLLGIKRYFKHLLFRFAVLKSDHTILATVVKTDETMIATETFLNVSDIMRTNFHEKQILDDFLKKSLPSFIVTTGQPPVTIKAQFSFDSNRIAAAKSLAKANIFQTYQLLSVTLRIKAMPGEVKTIAAARLAFKPGANVYYVHRKVHQGNIDRAPKMPQSAKYLTIFRQYLTPKKENKPIHLCDLLWEYVAITDIVGHMDAHL
uniref:Uncharacterized protein n=1 Tax=Glossina austeni TaxID=7395 RepID=A0A1A9VMJ3_GLOAU